ncbi:hypothetical protein FAEPRAA2165_03336 [Faecalibacterium duncaniae]|uniref:Uncharacterized protein n=1 Tax=Faecalibacterium duncaniae (strain DSM 17677 / JCM 31915 / A2-165) TaxID=411483 RepID=C7HAH8_FAED2|nr:hypothetical protein FAEPRAA2165_03336 [Faecalibacterium duncaniae]
MVLPMTAATLLFIAEVGQCLLSEPLQFFLLMFMQFKKEILKLVIGKKSMRLSSGVEL